ncbi:hypothetical protein OHA40_01620 [Nocardia sp. NBC_00508]|uniref:hypothetical protein n=1 Tax=Nocardia sp. NBC_00508 TaxID=2975992 RepID=UPI002E813239|nr:hypothetical protein [Nocardia sp. NBC_00508]WUD66900.1 hypothetical protein OHA40_01620 [Nocardia sp. NBC_00508]
MTTELTVFSDYWQIHLLDSDSSTEVTDHWLDSALLDYLALADDAIGICTGVNDHVTVTIDVTDGPPADDKDAFDTVTECSLRADSGTLRLTSPTYGENDGDLVTVPTGWLRLRVSLTRSIDDEEYDEDSDDPADRRHIRIQCWPAEPSDAVLVKGWNSDTGSFHPARTD